MVDYVKGVIVKNSLSMVNMDRLSNSSFLTLFLIVFFVVFFFG